MRIPGQTTSRPPPAIFKVDVSCGTSSPSFLVPFAFLTAVISNLACSSITGSLLFVSMFGHYYAVVRTYASTNHYRGPDTTGISIPITYPFVYFAALRVTNLAIYNALLYGIGILSLSCYTFCQQYTDIAYYFISILLLTTESALYKMLRH